MGVIYSWLLVYWAAGEEHTVLIMDLLWSTQCILDDWIFQPTGIPHCYASRGKSFICIASSFIVILLVVTGDQSTQRLGFRLSDSWQWPYENA